MTCFGPCTKVRLINHGRIIKKKGAFGPENRNHAGSSYIDHNQTLIYYSKPFNNSRHFIYLFSTCMVSMYCTIKETCSPRFFVSQIREVWWGIYSLSRSANVELLSQLDAAKCGRMQVRMPSMKGRMPFFFFSMSNLTSRNHV